MVSFKTAAAGLMCGPMISTARFPAQAGREYGNLRSSRRVEGGKPNDPSLLGMILPMLTDPERHVQQKGCKPSDTEWDKPRERPKLSAHEPRGSDTTTVDAK
jgi:hypothetical protein